MNAILLLAALKVLAVGNGVELEDLSIHGFVADRLDACCRNHVAKTDPMCYAREFRSRAETGLWQTEFWGKYMLSAVPLAFFRNDAALKARIAESVKEVIADQEPNGYIGNYPPEKRAQSGGWDLWGNKYTMRGLLVWYEYAKDPAALAAAEKLAGYVMSLFGPGRRNLNETGCFRGLPSCSMLGAIVRLYRFTGKEEYRDFATYIVGQLDLDGRAPRLLADADVAPWERVTGPKVWLDSSRKSYEQMSCYQGLVEYSLETGDRRGLEAAAKTAEAIRTGEINIVGGASCSENWYGGATNQVTTHVFENETCVLTTWMRLCELLLGATGEAKWADELEKTFYNAYLGAMRPDGSAFEVYAALSGRRHAGSNHCRLYTNCCTANGPRGFLAFLCSVMTAEKGTVKLNQYVSGDASVVLPDSGRRVTLETYALYPKMNTASIRYREREPKAFVLKLRIPSWSRKTEVRLNGKALEGPVAGEYFAVEREWRSGDQIDVAFDYTPQKFELRGHMAFKIGPLVLARDRRFADGDLGETVARHRWIADPMEAARVFPTRTAREDMYFTAIGLVATGQHTKDPAETYPTAMNFCDYASAGNTWTDASSYRVWLPIEAPLPEEEKGMEN